MGSSAHITASQTLKLIWWCCILVDFSTELSNIFAWCLIETFCSLKWVIQNKNLSTWKNIPNYLIHTSLLFWYMLFGNYKTTQSNPHFPCVYTYWKQSISQEGIGLERIGEAFSHVLRMRMPAFNSCFRTSDGSAMRNSAGEGRIPGFIYCFSVSTSVLWKCSLFWCPARLADVRTAQGKICWEVLESHHHHFHITRGRWSHNSI